MHRPAPGRGALVWKVQSLMAVHLLSRALFRAHPCEAGCKCYPPQSSMRKSESTFPFPLWVRCPMPMGSA